MIASARPRFPTPPNLEAAISEAEISDAANLEAPISATIPREVGPHPDSIHVVRPIASLA